MSEIRLFQSNRQYKWSKRAHLVYMFLHENLLQLFSSVLGFVGIFIGRSSAFQIAGRATHIRITNFTPSLPRAGTCLCIKPPENGWIWRFHPLPKFLKTIFLRKCIYNFNGINNANPTASWNKERMMTSACLSQTKMLQIKELHYLLSPDENMQTRLIAGVKKRGRDKCLAGYNTL